jgi:hypothetical protein
MADNGKDVSGFFAAKGRMIQPIQGVSLDLTAGCCRNLIEPHRI